MGVLQDEGARTYYLMYEITPELWFSISVLANTVQEAKTLAGAMLVPDAALLWCDSALATVTPTILSACLLHPKPDARLPVAQEAT